MKVPPAIRIALAAGVLAGLTLGISVAHNDTSTMLVESASTEAPLPDPVPESTTTTTEAPVEPPSTTTTTAAPRPTTTTTTAPAPMMPMGTTDACGNSLVGEPVFGTASQWTFTFDGSTITAVATSDSPYPAPTADTKVRAHQVNGGFMDVSVGGPMLFVCGGTLTQTIPAGSEIASLEVL